MLRKCEPLQVDPDDPFKNDGLNREELAQNLMQMIQSLRQPFVLAINGPWGTGKTTFIQMWSAQLRKLGHVSCYYNAWESDFCEEPLLGFLAEIQSSLKTVGSIAAEHSATVAAWDRVKGTACRVLRRVGPVALQVVTQGLVSAASVGAALPGASEAGNSIAQFAGDTLREMLDRTEETRDAIRSFQEDLGELAQLIAKERRGPIVIFVDELDRCRPPYAITLLERIKHLFGVKGVVFVLAVDREPLSHSLRSVYGQQMDTDGYLRRFIDLRCDLPKIDIKQACTLLWRRLDMDEALGQRRQGRDEKDLLLAFLRDSCLLMDLSLRSAEQLCAEMNVIVRSTPPTKMLLAHVMPVLLLLRNHAPGLLRDYAAGDAGAEDIFTFLEQKPRGREVTQRRHWQVARGCLLRWSRKAAEQAWLRGETAVASAIDQKRRSELLALYNTVLYEEEDLLDYCLGKVTLSSRFTAE